MGLVDYSESESEHDDPKTTTTSKAPRLPASASTKSAPTSKLINRSAAGKILVGLRTPTANKYGDFGDDENTPVKRARLGGREGSQFSRLSSLLPPPKNIKPTQPKSGKAPRVGVNFTTGTEVATEVAFLRGGDEGGNTYGDAGATEEDDAEGTGLASTGFGLGRSLGLLRTSTAAGPSIPAGQKPAEEVKLVGKPLMFRPLSVARNTKKTKKVKSAAKSVKASATALIAVETTSEVPAAPKIRLFGMDDEEDRSRAVMTPPRQHDDDYPSDSLPQDDAFTTCAEQEQARKRPVAAQAPQPTLMSLAENLNLNPAQRRELFGRKGPSPSASSLPTMTSFNLEREYAENEALRRSGQLAHEQHNPVRAIAPGKHTLRQMVDNVHNNRNALEESFAQQRGVQGEARGRYGWT